MNKRILPLVFVLTISFLNTTFPQGLDYGDAPDPGYPTLSINNGAFHLILPGLQLGTYVDGEVDGQPGPLARGDDQNLQDDADGVIFNSWIIAGQNSSVIVKASNVGTTGLLNAWIDFNADGDWLDAGEQIFTDSPMAAGSNTLTFAVPATISAGVTVARFRYSTQGGLTPIGFAPDGEVEDYQLQLGVPLPGVIFLDPDPTMAFTQNEISLACIPDPNFGTPSLIVAAYNDEPHPGGPGMGVSYSTNGGTTWINTHLVYPTSSITGAVYADVFDPTICIDDSGHLFVGQIATDFNWATGPESSLYIHKSTNGGVSWKSPVQVSVDAPPSQSSDSNYRFNDRDQIVADRYSMSPYYNNIYITWIKDRGWNMSQPWSDIYFAYSTNGGNTFSSPLQINSWANNMGNMPVPDVAKNGTVYVAWMDYNVQSGGIGRIFLDKSTDGGVSFGPDILVDSVNLPTLNLNNYSDARAKGAPVVKVKPSNPNELYIVFAEDPDGPGPDEADIFFIKSTNGGSSWSNPKRVNDDVGSTDQVLPWMFVKPNGIIDIAWYDRRNDLTDQKWDVYFTSSLDGGNNFATNTRISGISFATPTPPKTPDKWMGEYLGLTADYTKAYIGYTSSITDNKGDVLFGFTTNPLTGMDWGDAPDPTYPTRGVNDGARHANDGATWLGSFCDTEPDALPNATATGDDIFNAVDDEDGVVFPAVIKKGLTDTLKVTVTNNGLLNAWFDFNADGDWSDAGEAVFVNRYLNTGLNNLLLTIPWNAHADTTFARFRFATYGGLSYTGSATDGEVEDYMIVIIDSVPPNLTLQGATVTSGQSTCYNATDTLFVAGFSAVVLNTTVNINSGGNATFIAGKAIYLQYGFHAHQGSIVNAHITTDSTYCGGQAPSMVSSYSAGKEPTGISEGNISEDQRVNVYPNPTNGRLTIDLRMNYKDGMIRLLDFQGASLYQTMIKNQRFLELDISNFPSGIYLVMIQVEGKLISRKVVKY